MSASGAGGDRVRDLFNRAAAADSIGGILFQGIGAVFFAVGTAIASGILTLADVFIIPTQSFIGAVGDLITATFGGAARIINFGAIASAISIGPGGLFASPLSFVFAIGIVLLALYVVLAYISEEDTTNFFPLIGTGFDVPTPGFIDAEEEEEG
ncbi:hypothetical protein [Haloarcula pellucida]|uniref:Uncharacterized protein n=1 Tax=Haloarcula pellucida TaxID=1427151 RepID=A0A830GJI4_9EURY|nr:hypothetical protein [Halomicroarcula pellucida]MBX0348674.1 hypothetical protein [Halomicroarcula pellucida]GGN92274.1 hypothetical protein GCM10009030_16350 [Halomicroarcula pellucida]